MNIKNYLQLYTRVLFALLFLVILGCSPQVDLLSNIQESQANEVISVLEQHGIQTQKNFNKEFVTLKVKREDMPRAIDILRDWGLPRNNNTNLGSVFKKDGLISSPLEERARYIYALSQELEQTLGKIDGVITARVHVVLPETDNFGETYQPAAASVFIKYHQGASVGTQIGQIKRLVVNSIPGLSPDKITVSLFPSQLNIMDEDEENIGRFAKYSGKKTESSFLWVWLLLVALLFAIGAVLLLKPVRNYLSSLIQKIKKSKKT